MKTANITIFIGVLVCGLIERTPLHAQSTSAPVTVEGDDKPWNQGVPTATREAARALFRDGNRLFNIPLFAQASEKYVAALAEWKHPAFYFNLALAQLNLGQEVEARDNLERALKYGEEPLGAEQYQEAQKQRQGVERRLGRIRITCPTQGAEVTLDGATVFTGPGSFEGWVTAKDHEITAKKPDYLPQARRVAVAPGKLQELDLRLVTLSEATDTSRRWAVWKPWAVVAAGVAVAAGGGALHALSSKNFNAYDGMLSRLDCAKSIGCTDAAIGPDLNMKLTLARREQQIAIAGYITGGSLIAAGSVLLYLNRPRLVEQGTMRSSPRNLAIAPVASHDMLGILVSMSH